MTNHEWSRRHKYEGFMDENFRIKAHEQNQRKWKRQKTSEICSREPDEGKRA